MSAFATMDQNDFSSMDAKLESLNLQGDIEVNFPPLVHSSCCTPADHMSLDL